MFKIANVCGIFFNVLGYEIDRVNDIFNIRRIRLHFCFQITEFLFEGCLSGYQGIQFGNLIWKTQSDWQIFFSNKVLEVPPRDWFLVERRMASLSLTCWAMAVTVTSQARLAGAVDRVVPAVSPGPSAHWRAVTIYSPNDMYPLIIAQVYRLSAVHCQMTRYSQRVPGYLTRYSVSANEISFDKKICQWDCVFQIRLGLEENDFPLHLVTSTGFWRPNWRTIQNMALKYVIFL